MTMTLQEMAAKGGRERAKKLSKARRHEIALKAGLANAAKIKAKQDLSMSVNNKKESS